MRRAEVIEWIDPADRLPDDNMCVLAEFAFYERGDWCKNEILAVARDGDKWRPIDDCAPTDGRLVAWAQWPNGLQRFV